MSQLTFSEAEYNTKKRKIRREKFLERMEKLIPWEKLEQQVAKKILQREKRPKTLPTQPHVAGPRHAATLQSE